VRAIAPARDVKLSRRMTKQLVLAVLLASTTLATADTKCTITKAADKDVSIEVHFKPSKMFAETNCRLDSRKTAEAWVKDNKACAKGKAAFDYHLVFTVDDKSKEFDLHGFCPDI
jgi:hypothetical protein